MRLKNWNGKLKFWLASELIFLIAVLCVNSSPPVSPCAPASTIMAISATLEAALSEMQSIPETKPIIIIKFNSLRSWHSKHESGRLYLEIAVLLWQAQACDKLKNEIHGLCSVTRDTGAVESWIRWHSRDLYFKLQCDIICCMCYPCIEYSLCNCFDACAVRCR